MNATPAACCPREGTAPAPFPNVLSTALHQKPQEYRPATVWYFHTPLDTNAWLDDKPGLGGAGTKHPGARPWGSRWLACLLPDIEAPNLCHIPAPDSHQLNCLPSDCCSCLAGQLQTLISTFYSSFRKKKIKTGLLGFKTFFLS